MLTAPVWMFWPTTVTVRLNRQELCHDLRQEPETIDLYMHIIYVETITFLCACIKGYSGI